MTHELHLPDLPDVPASLGDPPGPSDGAVRGHMGWGTRVRMVGATYLPLMLMALLALGTWWLVKNAPKPPVAREKVAARHVADYTMARFSIERYDPQGRPTARLLGEQLRHFPDTDEIEIDTVHLIATGEDGRITHATARRAVASDDGNEVRMEGGAKVVSTGVDGDVVEIDGERLIAHLKDRRLVADRPVQVRQGNSEFSADALEFDQAAGQLMLHGKVQARLTPQAVRGLPKSAAANPAAKPQSPKAATSAPTAR